jgi:hypothetical protein
LVCTTESNQVFKLKLPSSVALEAQQSETTVKVCTSCYFLHSTSSSH